MWKLSGLSEYDARRPMTSTGTNILGVIKHLAGLEAGYFGATFGRPFPEQCPGFEEGAEPNADMWATPDESREQIVGLYQRACAPADATFDALPIETMGRVPWWGKDGTPASLHKILVHMVAETHRHAGHADVMRELIDGSVGYMQEESNMPDRDQPWWESYRDRVEQGARESAERAK